MQKWVRFIGSFHCIHLVLYIYTTEIKKVLTKLSKEKGCDVIGRWKKACVRHFYWSVTSTALKLCDRSDVVVAKFKAFFHHILNIHHNLPNKIFNRCAHGPNTTQRVWLTKGIFSMLYLMPKIVLIN